MTSPAPHATVRSRIGFAGALCLSLAAVACAVEEGESYYGDDPGSLGKADGLGEQAELDPTLRAMALAVAEQAHSEGHGLGNPSILSIVDFRLSSAQKRLWIIDTSADEVLFNERVAHGRNSGDNHYATRFSNVVDSNKSNLGVLEVNETGVGGSVGPYVAVDGLEAGINHNARRREILVHGAEYASDRYYEQHGYTGKSLGCFSVRPDVIRDVMDTVSGGSLLLVYYPDDNLLQNSRFISPNLPWIGTVCEPGNDDTCDFSYGNAEGTCYDGGGYCVMSCAGTCPDRYGHATTFCVANPDGGGMCVPKSEEANGFCADVPGTVAETRDRYVGTSGVGAASAVVCVPGD